MKHAKSRAEVLLEQLKEESHKLKDFKESKHIAYTWDVEEIKRRLHDHESRISALESILEDKFPEGW